MANEEEMKGLKAQMKWCIESIKAIAEAIPSVVLKDEPPDEKPPN